MPPRFQTECAVLPRDFHISIEKMSSFVFSSWPFCTAGGEDPIPESGKKRDENIMLVLYMNQHHALLIDKNKRTLYHFLYECTSWEFGEQYLLINVKEKSVLTNK